MVFRDRLTTQVAAQVLVVAGSVLFALGQDAAPVSNLSTEAIVERLMTARNRQARQLQTIDVVRDYRVDYQGFGGNRHAEMQVVSSYVSPNKKDFRIVSQSGSRFLLDHILGKLLDSEKDAQLDEADSDLSPRNYQFQLLGTEQVAGNDAYILQITPRRKAKYLCRGKIWVNVRDFALVRLEGEPAKNPSFWVSHTQMANTYQKLGDYWLPVHKDATTDVRLGGKAVLAIDFSGYHITEKPRGSLEASSWTLFGLPSPDTRTTDHR
ncbi:MAG TPA: sigma-E factor regulatory protein RseB domain-containing protein [Terriglobales bacterium]|nr:sigma-E factor regulatory protein RseB domain-containing protein [Terriglobales bacterium]